MAEEREAAWMAGKTVEAEVEAVSVAAMAAAMAAALLPPDAAALRL